MLASSTLPSCPAACCSWGNSTCFTRHFRLSPQDRGQTTCVQEQNCRLLPPCCSPKYTQNWLAPNPAGASSNLLRGPAGRGEWSRLQGTSAERTAVAGSLELVLDSHITATWNTGPLKSQTFLTLFEKRDRKAGLVWFCNVKSPYF